MKRIDEVPDEVQSVIEAVEVGKDGCIVKVWFWNKLQALRVLATMQKIVGADEAPPGPSSATINYMAMAKSWSMPRRLTPFRGGILCCTRRL